MPAALVFSIIARSTLLSTPWVGNSKWVCDFQTQQLSCWCCFFFNANWPTPLKTKTRMGILNKRWRSKHEWLCGDSAVALLWCCSLHGGKDDALLRSSVSDQLCRSHHALLRGSLSGPPPPCFFSHFSLPAGSPPPSLSTHSYVQTCWGMVWTKPCACCP